MINSDKWQGNKNQPSPEQKESNKRNEIRVHGFLISRGIFDKNKRVDLIIKHALFLGSNPRKNKIHRTICSSSSTWKKYKNWVDKTIGYVKPSKINQP